MDFDEQYGNDEEEEMSDSIFEDSLNKPLNKFELGSSSNIKYNAPQNGSLILKFFDAVSSKLNEISNEKNIKNLQKEADKLFEGNEEIFKVFHSFGCKLVYDRTSFKIICEPLKLTGTIKISKQQELEWDENAKKIIEYISNVVISSNSLESTLDNYEKEGFLPVGEMELKKIEINGAEREVLVGILKNSAGEEKTIYYYNGREIFLKPDEEE
ncbi:hypothetical protein J6O48_01325 [bacterium]|nr:hypothetical protein [bacterium]